MSLTSILRIPLLRNPAIILAIAQFVAVQSAFSAAAPADTVLYDQSDLSSLGGASPTQQTASWNSEIADDFDVTDAEGWTITGVKLSMNFAAPDGTPPGQPPYLIAFYPDQDGLPGNTAACEYGAASAVTDETPPANGLNAAVTLPTPCTLAPGHYWMAMSVVLEPLPYSLWIYNAPPSYIGYEPAYRNPDDNLGTGCVAWTSAYSNGCLFSFPGAQGKENMVFQLLGTIGAGDLIFFDGFE
jgi:hypothetical protein